FYILWKPKVKFEFMFPQRDITTAHHRSRMVLLASIGDFGTSCSSGHGIHVASFVPAFSSTAPLHGRFHAIPELRPSSSRMLTATSSVSRRRRIMSTSLAAAAADGAAGAASAAESVGEVQPPAPAVDYGADDEIQPATQPPPAAAAVKKAPASARLALDNARKLVRERRQQAKDRQAATAAAASAAAAAAAAAVAAAPGAAASSTPPETLPSSSVHSSSGLSARRPSGTAIEPGGMSPRGGPTQVDVASTFVKAATSQSQRPQSDLRSSSTTTTTTNINTPATRTPTQGYPRGGAGGRGAGGGGGVKRRGRVLPDFSWVNAASASRPLGDAVKATSSLGGAATSTSALGQEKEEEQSGDDAALVAAIRATLESTMAQLDAKRVSKVGVGV
ncbi:unnamed protein product, partial [Laminaria digitata]